jgi:hypothetical protein
MVVRLAAVVIASLRELEPPALRARQWETLPCIRTMASCRHVTAAED